ncbi:MAG: hypothetical protein HZB53_06145 [Chloroflexi bacterium]|nr:hypothetical protein [Chloroflexota bacterium]
MNQPKEDLTPFGVLLLRVMPTLAAIGLLCACGYFFILPNAPEWLAGRVALPFFATAAPTATLTLRPAAPTAAIAATAPRVGTATQTPAPTSAARATTAPNLTAAAGTPRPAGTTVALPTAAPNTRKLLWGVVDFPSYNASIGALYFGPQNGVDIQVVNLTGQKESDLCKWLLTDDGQVRVLFDTPNSPVACSGAKAAVKSIAWVDKSDGADGMVCRKEVTTWNQALSGRVIGAGDFSVSQVAWYQMNYALQNPPGQYVSADDAGPAHDTWMQDASIPCAVLWEPWISGSDQIKGALTVPGAHLLWSTKAWAGINDVIEYRYQSELSPQIRAGLKSYFQFLKLMMEDKDKAWTILAGIAQAGQDDGVFSYTVKDDFYSDLGLTAQATFDQNRALFGGADQAFAVARFDEIKEVIKLSNGAVKDGANDQPIDPAKLPESAQYIDSRYVQALANDPDLQTQAKPVNPNFNTKVIGSLKGDIQNEAFQTSIGQLKSLFIEFGPNSAVILDRKGTAEQVNSIVVPLLRLCSSCSVRIIGRYALPTTCIDCTVEAGRALAIQRAQALRKFMEAPYALDAGGVPTGLGFPAGRIITPNIAHDPEARDADPNSTINRSQRRDDLDVVTSNAY